MRKIVWKSKIEWVRYPVAVVGIYSSIAMSRNESDFFKGSTKLTANIVQDFFVCYF